MFGGGGYPFVLEVNVNSYGTDDRCQRSHARAQTDYVVARLSIKHSIERELIIRTRCFYVFHQWIEY